jgi:transcriptional repressor NrdR
MKCPFCQHQELKVTDSRYAPDQNAIRRRRECLGCNRRFTTFETVELTMQVHKRDGRYEDFRRDKLINGLRAACRHTSVSAEQEQTLAAEIVSQLTERHCQAISSREIGEMVMRGLQKLDSIAYVRFACEYRRFREVDELVDLIKSIEAPCDASYQEQKSEGLKV